MVFFSMTRTKDSSEVDIWTRVGNFQSTFFLLVKEKKKEEVRQLSESSCLERS